MIDQFKGKYEMKIEMDGAIYNSLVMMEHDGKRTRIMHALPDCWVVVVTDFTSQLSRAVPCISREHAIEIFAWCTRAWLEEVIVH